MLERSKSFVRCCYLKRRPGGIEPLGRLFHVQLAVFRPCALRASPEVFAKSTPPGKHAERRERELNDPERPLGFELDLVGEDPAQGVVGLHVERRDAEVLA